MSSKTDSWFIAERSEALAGAMLTSRSDVRIRTENKHDWGLDFLVEIETADPLSKQLFVVQVKGTVSSNPSDWMQGVKQLFRSPGSPIFFPICLFVVNVRDNNAFFAWVAEPEVEAKNAKLRFHSAGTFSPLDTVAVNTIIEQVKDWYQVLPNQLMPT